MDALVGFTFKDWLRLLRENHFSVDRPYWGRAATISFMSLFNSIGRRREKNLWVPGSLEAQVRAPVFILGHWRSGTTLLHNLLAQDPQFAYPNLFQITNPHTFLVREAKVVQALGGVGGDARPMDNVEITFRSPGEDESALAALCLRSPLLGWMFPRREAFYDRYLTFRDAPEHDLAAWKSALTYFLQKLSWRYGRTLLLKSPVHTGRVRLLLDLFPDARFIHIHRDPYVVFRSTQKLFATAVPESHLQRPSVGDPVEGILERYHSMYAAFFEDVALIPPGQYYEIRFEALEADMLGQVAGLYEGLGLPNFRDYEPVLKGYINSLSGYQKNAYSPLPEDLRQKISSAWERNFDLWGYAREWQEIRA